MDHITEISSADSRHLGGDDNQPIGRKFISLWENRELVEAQGFNFDIVGDQADVRFQRNLALDLASDPTNSAYTASRMTEIDTWKPITERVKYWQASPTSNVVVEFRVRFDQRVPPPGLNENLMLWNAPFPSTTPEPARPVTAIGVSRTSSFGQPQYVAAITQNLDINTFAQPFIFEMTPMPAWLDAGEWHDIRITLSHMAGQVEVAQGARSFVSVARVELLYPAEPLGFEFSVDNEMIPGTTVPVAIPDCLEISYLSIQMERFR
jgi:hypothetical protein